MRLAFFVLRTSAPLIAGIRRRDIKMKRSLVFVFIGLWSCSSVASPTAVPVRAEIDALLSKLQSSGCSFERNGSWYSASEAKGHLLRKLEYIEGRRTIQNAEQFIELAASKSSSSGKPYHVKCGTEAIVESQIWLNAQLVTLRVGNGKP